MFNLKLKDYKIAIRPLQGLCCLERLEERGKVAKCGKMLIKFDLV